MINDLLEKLWEWGKSWALWAVNWLAEWLLAGIVYLVGLITSALEAAGCEACTPPAGWFISVSAWMGLVGEWVPWEAGLGFMGAYMAVWVSVTTVKWVLAAIPGT